MTLPAPQIQTDEEDIRPLAFKTLFPGEDRIESDLEMITEIPSNMLLAIVNLEVWQAASDLERVESLSSVYLRSLRKNMISRDRKGRIEAVELMNQTLRKDNEDDDIIRM